MRSFGTNNLPDRSNMCHESSGSALTETIGIVVNGDDIAELGFAAGDPVNVISKWTTTDGEIEERRAERFRTVAYPNARGCAAAYYPEANPLIPLNAVADRSNTPVSKAIIIRLEHA